MPSAKSVLVPMYNRTVRAVETTRRYAEALRHRRFQRCSACGRWGPILYEPRIIPRRLVELWGLTPPLASAFAHKESDWCSYCGANRRARRLASAILRAFPTTPPARSLAEWVRRPEAQALRVAEINLIDGLHPRLVALPNLRAADYESAGLPSEDLTSLSYPDTSFDLVLTSETLEHVPDLDRALAELFRVMVPGGKHLFTVPVRPDVPRTFARNDHPKLYHPGGDVGYLVHTEFGLDLYDRLRGAGWNVEVWFGPVREDDVAQVWVCAKPEAGS